MAHHLTTELPYRVDQSSQCARTYIRMYICTYRRVATAIGAEAASERANEPASKPKSSRGWRTNRRLEKAVHARLPTGADGIRCRSRHHHVRLVIFLPVTLGRRSSSSSFKPCDDETRLERCLGSIYDNNRAASRLSPFLSIALDRILPSFSDLTAASSSSSSRRPLRPVLTYARIDAWKYK